MIATRSKFTKRLSKQRLPLQEDHNEAITTRFLELVAATRNRVRGEINNYRTLLDQAVQVGDSDVVERISDILSSSYELEANLMTGDILSLQSTYMAQTTKSTKEPTDKDSE